MISAKAFDRLTGSYTITQANIKKINNRLTNSEMCQAEFCTHYTALSTILSYLQIQFRATVKLSIINH